MSNALIPFSDAALPSTIVNRTRLIDVNKDVVIGAQFPSLSIKGRVFTIVRDNEKQVMTKPDDPEEILQSVNVALLRLNMHGKTYYSKKFTEDDSEGARPDCYSFDGVAPAPSAGNKQSATCALCPHNVWGSRISDDNTGKGKACADRALAAIAAPDALDKPLQLRIPPKSLRPLKDALKLVKQRDIQYNEVIFRVGFNRDESSPVLTFKPVGVLGDTDYARACELYESEVVRAIVGADGSAAALAAPIAPAAAEPDELDAALQARNATRKVAPPAATADEVEAAIAAPAPAPAPAPAKAKPAPAAKAAAKPAPAASVAATDATDLLGDLDGLLGNLDG